MGSAYNHDKLYIYSHGNWIFMLMGKRAIGPNVILPQLCQPV